MSSTIASEPAGRRPWPLATRLAAWYAVTAFLLVLLATGFWYWVLVTNLQREDDDLLADKVQALRMLLQDSPTTGMPLRQEIDRASAPGQRVRFYVRILGPDGQTILESPGMREDLPPAIFLGVEPGGAGLGHGLEVHSPAGRSYRVVTTSAASGEHDTPKGVLQVAMDCSLEEDLLAAYRSQLGLVLGTALLLCTLAGYWIARRGIRPVAEIVETARRMRSSTLDQRLAVQGLPAELFQLASTFNEMFDRLEESFSRLARFSADIAHELRTPVNILRGEAEVALGKPRSPEEYREVLASGLEECVRLSHLIDNLLFLARAESPQSQIVREPVDIGRELEGLREFYEAAASEAGVAIASHSQAGIVAALDRALFQRAVGNLVANALAHTGPGGTVTLSAAAEHGAVRVEVADTGCGIASEHLPHVFDRFYRVDAARSSGSGRVGLGLAIAKSIAALHGGSAAITSKLGRGTVITLTFSTHHPAGSGLTADEGPGRGPPSQRPA
jgi:two-component system, OmpR family, heavy metal sensor histidine kinase CusS